jgi:hypothetical protein
VTRPPFCTVVHFDGSWLNLKSLSPTYGQRQIWNLQGLISMVTQTSNAEISMGWPPRICSILNWREIDNCIDLAEQITIRPPAPPMTNGNNYEKTFALKLFGSHTTRISIQLQIKYMTNKTRLWNIPYIHSNTHEYAMVVLSHPQSRCSEPPYCTSNLWEGLPEVSSTSC